MPSSDISPDRNSEQKTIDPLQNEFTGGSLAYLACINNYTNVPPLSSTHEDCDGLKKVLENKHGFKADILYDPGKQALLDLLQRMQAEGKEGSRVIFYFAGHGVADGTDEFDRPRGFLLPADAKRGIDDTYIEMAFVMDVLKNLKCRHLLIVLDCCYAGAFRFAEKTRSIGAEVPKTLYRQKFDYYVRAAVKQVITSASYDQKAADALGNRGEVNNNNRSPFADSLIRALDKGDADLAFGDIKPDGIITGSELGFYLSMMVSQLLSGSDVPLANQQTPSVFNIGDQAKGEFIFIHSSEAIANLANIVDRNPYKGLGDYSVDDNNLFYGRQRVLDGWWEGKVLHEGLLKIVTAGENATSHKYYRVLVTGRSGSGKSSLVKAGVLGKLQQADKDSVHIIKPGSTPFTTYKQLLEQISVAEKIQYLLVDQYEELITLCNDPGERKSFEDMLTMIADTKKAVVIITLRSDIERRFADSTFIGKPGNENIFRFVVPPFSREEIKEVVLQPASQQMLEFRSKEGSDKANEAFVNKIIDEAFANPDSLPLLSFALSRLYEKRDGINLTEAEYDDFGGISGILDNKFTEAYNMHAPAAEPAQAKVPSTQQLFRQLVLRMISFDAGTMAKRRIYTSFTTDGKVINELEFKRDDITETIRKIKDDLVEQRLLKTASEKDDQSTATLKAGENDNAYVEPAHEALLRSSNLVAEWQNEKTLSGISFQNKVLLLRSLSTIAQTYYFETDRRDKKGLRWKDDPRLAYVQKLAKNNEVWLNKTEEEFVQDSLKAKSRAKIISRVVIAIVFSLIAFAAVSSYIQNRKLQNQLAQNYWNNSLIAMGENEQLKSFLFLANAVDINTNKKVNNTMQFQLNHFFPSYLLTGLLRTEAHIHSFEISTDEKIMFTITDSSAEVWNIADKERLFSIPRKVRAGSLDKQGRKLYVQLDSTIECWDIEKKKKVNSFALLSDATIDWAIPINKIMVNQQGKIFLLDTNLIKSSWDVPGLGAKLSGDGKRLAAQIKKSNDSGSYNFADSFIVWDIGGPNPVNVFEERNNYGPSYVKMSETGKYLMIYGSTYGGSSLVIIDIKTQRPIKIGYRYAAVLAEFNDAETEAFFADDNSDFFVVDLEKFSYMNLWDSAYNQFQPLGDNFRSISFFPTSSIYKDSLLIDKDEGTALWNSNTGKMGKPLNLNDNFKNKSVFDSTNQRIVSLSEKGHLRFSGMTGEMEGLSFLTTDKLNLKNFRLSADGKKIWVAAGHLIYQYNFFDAPDEQTGVKDLLYSFFSTNGKYNFTIDKDNQASIWEFSEGTASRKGLPISVKELQIKKFPASDDYAGAMPSDSIVNNVLISHDGNVVSFVFDNRLYQLDFTRQLFRKINEDFSSYSLVENKQATVFLGDSGYIKSWNWLTGKSMTIFRIPDDKNDILLNPNGHNFIATSNISNKDQTNEYDIFNTAIFNVSQNDEPVDISYHKEYKYIDSNRLLEISSHQITVYDLKIKKGNIITTDFHVTKKVNKVLIGSDGKKLVVIYDNVNVNMVDLSTGKLDLSVKMRELNNDFNYSMSINEDGNRLAIITKHKVFFIDIATGKRSVKNYTSHFGKGVAPAGAFIGEHYYYFDGASVKCMGADLDLPAGLFQQQAIALTGSRLNEITKEPEAIPQEELIKLCNKYEQAAAAHYRHCKYKKFNTWKKIHPVNDN